MQPIEHACSVLHEPNSQMYGQERMLLTRRIGTEHEKLAVKAGTTRRAGYPEIRHILEGLRDRFGWEPIMEGGKTSSNPKPFVRHSQQALGALKGCVQLQHKRTALEPWSSHAALIEPPCAFCGGCGCGSGSPHHRQCDRVTVAHATC